MTRPKKVVRKEVQLGVRMALAASLGLAFAAPPAWAQSESNLQRTLPRAQPRQPESNAALREPMQNLDQLENVAVHPTDIRIAGVKSVPFAEISAVFSQFNNQDTTVGQLAEAAKKVADVYAQHGYALSFAYLPVQDMANGRVQIVVVEGYIGNVVINDAPPNLLPQIRRLAERLKEERPLRRSSFERYVSLISRLPGIGVDANVQPPQNTDGAAELTLDVHFKRFNTTAALDANHPGFEGMLSATVNGLTPLADQLTASIMWPRGDYDKRYYSVEYALPLGSDGLMLRASAYRYEGKANQVYYYDVPLNQSYRDARGSVMLSYPLILEAGRSVMLEGGVYGSGSGEIYSVPGVDERLDLRANVRAAQLGINASWQRERYSAEASAQVIRAFKGVGSSQLEDLVDLEFVKTRVSANRRDSWGEDNSIGTFINATYQHSGRRLPTSEKIVFGGSYFASAYPSGDASGDTGWAISGEISKGFLLKKAYLNSLQPFVGFDAAKVKNATDFSSRDTLKSGFVGLRFDVNEKLNVAISAAKPIGVAPLGETGKPWRYNLQGGVSF
ncbi:hemolysin activation/secretion protein [Pseudoduganella lurida]|uniref:Hemolysin activation/secretion protein n=1 Tax=Pseudoduganella lurida TaxID=1036180 RepID=A0A562RBD0_9BURK|nr:POTRA domain-containing protein [Pseudoduganella lurida]TWI66367.1 hemolysin activation/secretion protein [Pseudoduganella lurida]